MKTTFLRFSKSKKSQRKAQAAVEFMATYGWALLIVSVAIGAIAYFGVIDPSDVIPEKCDFNNGIVCKDISATAPNTIKLVLLNNHGQTIYDVRVSVLTPTGVTFFCVPSPVSTVNVDTSMTITCAPMVATPVFKKGEKTKITFKVLFKKTSDGYDQVSKGEAYTTVN